MMVMTSLDAIKLLDARGADETRRELHPEPRRLPWRAHATQIG
jgi:hypothetical protein